MLEFLIEFKIQILKFLNFMLPIVTISFMSLGFVSIAGKLWEIVETDHSKNILASFCLLILSFIYQRSLNITYDLIWDTLELLTLSSIFYIGFCWRFYSRLDALMDKKIGEDNFKPSIKKRKKKK